jgi:hypothetical protein
MKLNFAFPLLLLAGLATPALADNATAAARAEGCRLIGPVTGQVEECQAFRAAFRTAVNACMQRLHSDADAKAGQPTRHTAHTSRARFMICDAATREVMGVPAK